MTAPVIVLAVATLASVQQHPVRSNPCWSATESLLATTLSELRGSCKAQDFSGYRALTRRTCATTFREKKARAEMFCKFLGTTKQPSPSLPELDAFDYVCVWPKADLGFFVGGFFSPTSCESLRVKVVVGPKRSSRDPQSRLGWGEDLTKTGQSVTVSEAQ